MTVIVDVVEASEGMLAGLVETSEFVAETTPAVNVTCAVCVTSTESVVSCAVYVTAPASVDATEKLA